MSKLNVRGFIWPLLKTGIKHHKQWRQTFPELNYLFLISKKMSFEMKIIFFLTLVGAYPIVCKLKNRSLLWHRITLNNQTLYLTIPLKVYIEYITYLSEYENASRKDVKSKYKWHVELLGKRIRIGFMKFLHCEHTTNAIG